MTFYYNEPDRQIASVEWARYNGIGQMPAYYGENRVPYDVSNNPTRRRENFNPERSDLGKLRQAAAREIVGAVYHYFTASRESLNEPFINGTTYQQYFAHEAEDEMRHYLDEMRLISRLDPGQRAQFIDHDLQPYMVGERFPSIEFWYGPFSYPPTERESRWLKTIEHVVESIKFELDTIQFYENMIAQAKDPVVREKIAEINTHEKGDLADFNQMLLKLLEVKKHPQAADVNL